VLNDPEIAALLAGGALRVEPFRAALKGFEPDGVQLWRVQKSQSIP
jgi:hypothetical protein